MGREASPSPQGRHCQNMTVTHVSVWRTNLVWRRRTTGVYEDEQVVSSHPDLIIGIIIAYLHRQLVDSSLLLLVSYGLNASERCRDLSVADPTSPNLDLMPPHDVPML